MFSRMWSFLRRHRRKIIVAGVVIVGADLLFRYAKRTLADYLEQKQKEILDRERKLKHFKNVESTCDRTAYNMMVNLKEAINKIHNTDLLVEKLKDPKSNKIEIWEELKLLAFSKLILIVYATTFLMVTLRIELNLMGGYIFKSVTGEKNDNFNSDLREKYLQINEYFLTDGVKKLSALVLEKVRLVLSTHSLKEKLTQRSLEQIFYSIHTAVISDPLSPFTQFPTYILPSNDLSNDPMYQQIIIETKDLLETEEVLTLVTRCVIRGLTYFNDIIGEEFIDRSAFSTEHAKTISRIEDATSDNNSNRTSDTPKVSEPVPAHSKSADNHSTANGTSPGTSIVAQTSALSPDEFFAANLPRTEGALLQKTIPMAKIIPVLNNIFSNNDVSKDGIWIKQLIAMDDLKLLGANVYECFSV